LGPPKTMTDPGFVVEGSPVLPQKESRSLGRAFGIAVLVGLFAAIATAAALAVICPGNRVALSRVTRVALFLGFSVTFAVLRTAGRPPLLEACGLVPAHRPALGYMGGFAAGAVPLVLLVAFLCALGAREIDLRGGAQKLTWLAAKFFVQAIPLVVLEEGLFRGLLLGDAVRRLGRTAGVLATALFFAATHFLGVQMAWRAIPEPATNPLDAVVSTLTGASRMFEEWPEFIGLTLAACVLSVVRLRAGHAFAVMGIHAGWYWVKQMDRYFVDEVDAVVAKHRLWIGSEQYVDGVAGWITLLVTLSVAIAIRVPGSTRSSAT
jgi:membrane protease YdiL (CAAX protease family)